MKKERGVYEKHPGSGVWWIRYSDASGRIRRERAGTKTAAKKLYQIRKAEVFQGRKLPENLRVRRITFSEIAEDALAYSAVHKPGSYRDDQSRMPSLVGWFGNDAIDTITPEQIRRKLEAAQKERDWAPATVNRYKALFSMAFRLALENGKATVNPVRLVRRQAESDGVVVYLKP